jgi:EAL domain-containing protein (putative c-di-GMP-specific phosphodiesterase class I)
MANTLSSSPLMLKKYSVIAFKLRRFSSISKVFEEKDVDELLRQGAKILAGICSYDESYAYLGEGTFGMLLKYTDENSFAKRISMIKGISAKNPFAISKGLTLRFRVGVCHAFGGTRSSATVMIENAITACKIANERTNAPFIVFDKKINEEVARNEKIESMMEDGLRNGDFKLFLQPKYNIKSDRIDSAEALVRWFDRERADYIFPAEFISLFETNGFIVKLDHYIYLEVLQYFKSAVERGEKVVPISVNVSRVTISSPDFLNFYINNKRKFGIGDNFIMLELTESFALDDNNSIKEIVEELRKNGIKCSLDDFGSGFSSFNVLKSIPFDELKLDRCFIEKTDQPEKDEIVLKMVIEMAKSLGITIVQEGVETKEMLEKITKYGCDVAQGYYYAKAISLEEFKVFLKTNTSIEFKSRVK